MKMFDPFDYCYMVSREYGHEEVSEYEWEPVSVYDFKAMKEPVPVSREKFDKDWMGLKSTAEEWGLDMEAFWNVALYIYYRSNSVFHGMPATIDSPYEVLMGLYSRLNQPGVVLSVEGGCCEGKKLHKVEICRKEHLKAISDALIFAAKEMRGCNEIGDMCRSVDFNSTIGGKETEMAAFATRRYLRLFENLKNKSMAFTDAAPSDNEVMDFISKMLFFTGVVKSEKYLCSLNNIKGALNSYPADPD